MLSETIKVINFNKYQYFDKKDIKYEIIIVNDGSRDKTFDLIKRMIDVNYKNNEIFGINYSKNAGKGYAVRTVKNIINQTGYEIL